MQRVPATEKRGRRHSSEVTVVWLEGARTPDVRVRTSDVRVDTYRDSGPGGQHRNKTDSAVRLTHLPTGTVVTAVEDRSQHVNRRVAWERLEAAIHSESRRYTLHQENAERRGHFEQGRAWTWTGWRDEVRGPDGQRTSMRRALAGRLGPLVK